MEIQEQLKTVKRGVAEIVTEDELLAKLKLAQEEKRPLRVKLGLDPTAPDIHLGFAVVLRKLKQFQDLGHEVVVIIGDFTAMIGDPSGVSEIRRQLSEEEIKENAKTYERQLCKILDPGKTRVVFNSSWLRKLDFAEVIRLSSKYTLARTLERDDFEQRYKEGKPIGLHELLYPLCQAYDSVAIEADIEMGGLDQKFNLMVCRDIQRQYEQEPEVAILMPLLIGLDGKQKMSKSLGNYIGITEPPDEMYGKVMSIPDELMMQYYLLATEAPEKEIKKIEKELKKGTLHPKEAKKRLAREIASIYHSREAAKIAEERFEAIFAKQEIALKEKMEAIKPKEIKMPKEMLKEGKIWICRLLVFCGLARSHSEARRLIEQGAVDINGSTEKNPDLDLPIRDGMLIKVGKRRFISLRIA